MIGTGLFGHAPYTVAVDSTTRCRTPAADAAVRSWRVTFVSSTPGAPTDGARRERQVDDGVGVREHRGIGQRVGAPEVDEPVLDLGVLPVGRPPIEGEDAVDVGRLRQQAHDPPADGARRPGHDHTLHALTLARPGGIPSPRCLR